MAGVLVMASLLLLLPLCESFLVQEAPLVLEYHKGVLLKGNVTINLIWYGDFTAAQRSIIVDFIAALPAAGVSQAQPSVSSWWKTTSKYSGQGNHLKAGSTTLKVGHQVLHPVYTLGKTLTSKGLLALSGKIPPAAGAINVVLTASDVTVDGFCMNRCGTHGSFRGSAYLWVGNPATQCPGFCAWPFHQPIYGPQTPPLVAPNGDVGVDGMVITLASLLANTVTNPFRSGYFQGPVQAPLEAASACTGLFGAGSYPGYPGELLTDKVTGASFNAYGVRGRKHLLPAMWDPETSACKTTA